MPENTRRDGIRGSARRARRDDGHNYTIEIDDIRRDRLGWRRHRFGRRPLSERAVRPVLVEVLDINGEHAFELKAAEDQDPVEAFTASAADPALLSDVF